MQLLPRHSASGTTIFSVMSALAATHHAVNLSQGFPDFPVDEKLTMLMAEAAAGNYNQYAPMSGLPELRLAIAEDLQRRYRLAINPDTEVTITPGATYGIYAALATLLQPGDEVILPEPAYDSYRPNIEMNNGVPVSVPLLFPMFQMDWERIRKAITTKTKVIIINTPHNPSGSVWTASDREQLANILRDTGIFVIADEVYEQLVFDGKKHLSLLTHPELRAKSFVVFSFGKVFHNTGWKVGYVVAPAAFTTAFRQVHQYMTFSVNTPAQYALAKYLDSTPLPVTGDLMQQKRDFFLQLMAALPFTLHTPAAGSYFQLAGYEQISDMPDLEFAKWLTSTHGVATIPVSPFYSNHQDNRLVRFCFAKKESTLLQAAERLSGLKIR